jgi:hypothetical protein
VVVDGHAADARAEAQRGAAARGVVGELLIEARAIDHDGLDGARAVHAVVPRGDTKRAVVTSLRMEALDRPNSSKASRARMPVQ